MYITFSNALMVKVLNSNLNCTAFKNIPLTDTDIITFHRNIILLIQCILIM